MAILCVTVTLWYFDYFKKRKKIMEKDYKLKLKSSKVKLNLVARAATGNHSSWVKKTENISQEQMKMVLKVKKTISEAEPLQCLLCSNCGKEKLEHTREASNVLGSSLPHWSSPWAVHHDQMNTQIQAEEVHLPRLVSGLTLRDRVRSLVIQERLRVELVLNAERSHWVGSGISRTCPLDAS